MKIGILLAALMLGLAAIAAETGAELFQKALIAERAAGNLEEAIKLYQRVAKEFASDRALAAKALVQEARCYEKLGKDNAVGIYEQVARDYKDQREPSATAAARLAALRLGDRTAGPPTMTQRKIEMPFPNRAYYSDGQRLVSFDPATRTVMVSDLAGKDERVILKLKAGEQPAFSAGISRDTSIGFVVLKRADGLRLAVVKNDGTGYREINRISPSLSCLPDWSWDDRYPFVCSNEPDGTIQLLKVSVADEEVRKVRATDKFLHRPSPDGRFLALATNRFGKVFVVPTQGGEPQLVSDSARLIDWTRDGRYLIVDSAHSGEEALYLVPIKDGLPGGDPVFVVYGRCLMGQTTAAGALVCQSNVPGDRYGAWLGALDSVGHL